MPPNLEPPDLPPFDDDRRPPEPPPLDWELRIEDYPDDLPPSDWDPFTLDEILDSAPPPTMPEPEDPLRALDRRIEEAYSEMNTPDGSRRLDDLLEERDMLTEEIAQQSVSASEGDLVDARFLGLANQDAEGQITGYTVQYIELYEDLNNAVTGRVLDVGHYADLDSANDAYQALQGSIADGTITVQEAPLLAAGLAEENGLPPDDWRQATADDHARYDYHVSDVDGGGRDVPPMEVVADPDFAGNIFQQTTADPEAAAAAQAQLANEQAIAAMKGIGLATPDGFDLARDSLYDPERGERFINGIFQKDLDDPTQNCRPMLIALTTGEDGLGFAAQAVEFGHVGSLEDAQAEHNRVQNALERGGVMVGLETIESIETARLEQAIPAPEMAGWSGDIA